MPQGLPVHLTSFVGRDAEVAGLRRLLIGSRLVTLTGPGGAGKTRLAIEAARASAGDAVVFVDLAPIADQALIPSAIADALGLVELGGEPMLGRSSAPSFRSRCCSSWTTASTSSSVAPCSSSDCCGPARL